MRKATPSHRRYRDWAALHCLGLLDSTQASELDSHVAGGCGDCRAEIDAFGGVAAALAASAAPQRPPQDLRDRFLARLRPGPQVWKDWSVADPAALLVVRQGEGDWQNVVDGVYCKRLFVDAERDRVTMLIRMDPGASYVPHRHAGPEQCFVLEGDIREGGDVFHAGDFQCAATGSVHGVQSTRNGCLLLIVSSLSDQLLA